MLVTFSAKDICDKKLMRTQQQRHVGGDKAVQIQTIRRVMPLAEALARVDALTMADMVSSCVEHKVAKILLPGTKPTLL